MYIVAAIKMFILKLPYLFFINLFSHILRPYHSFSSLLAFQLLPHLPAPLTPPQKMADLQGYQPNMTHQVAIRPGSTSPIKAGGNNLGGKGSPKHASVRNSPTLLLGIPKKNHQAATPAEGLSQSHASSLVVGSVS